jgi:arabinogalactan oligomer / maltooligosaccharide transport system permease protein
VGSLLTAGGEVAYASQFMGANHRTLAVGIRTVAIDQLAGRAGRCPASVITLVPAAIAFLVVQADLVFGLTGRRADGTKA